MKFTKNYNFRSLSLENHLQTIYLLSFSLEIMQYIAFDQLIIRGSSALNCHGIVTPNTKSDCQWVEISLMVCVVIVCFQLFTNSRFFPYLFVWMLEPNSMPSIITLNTSKLGIFVWAQLRHVDHFCVWIIRATLISCCPDLHRCFEYARDFLYRKYPKHE